jgi:hypothetical protein
MTNRIAILLLAVIALAVMIDGLLGWGGTVFLLRKLLDLIQAMAFWR